MAETAGPDAVAAFARRRVAELERRYQPGGRGGQPRAAGAGAGRGTDRRRLRRRREGSAAQCRRPAATQLCASTTARSRTSPSEFPQLCEAETEAFGRLLGTPRPAPGHHRPRRRGLHHARPDAVVLVHIRSSDNQSGRNLRMTTTRPPGARGPGPLRVRLGRLRRRRRHRQARPVRGRSYATSRRKKNEPEWMLELRLKGLKLFGKQADADTGAPTCPGIDFDNIKYFVRSTEKQAATWDDLPDGHQEHLRQARHPRGGEAAPGLRRRRAVRVRGRLPPDPRGPRGAGRHLPGHRHRAAGAPGAVPGVLRHGRSRPATTSSPR